MAHILSAGKIMSIIPSGGKLNPRYVCSWRSYDRHWMPNAWFWHTFSWWHSPCQCVLAFFLRFAMFSAFMSLQNQRHFLYFSSIFQVLAHFCAPFVLSPRMQSTCHPDWTVSFKTLAVFWNKQAPVFSHLYCQRRKSWLTTQATGRYYTSPQPPKTLENTKKKDNIQKWQQSCPSRGAVTKNMPWGVKSKQWMNQYLLADEAYGWKTFLANHYC